MTTPAGTNENAPDAAAAAAAAAAAPAGQQQEQQEQPGSAAQWIPTELRTHKSLTKFKEPGDLAKSYVNLEGMLGKRVEIPGDDAPADVQAAWRTKIGVPATADEYEAPAVPQGMAVDEGVLSDARKQFHEIGIPKSAAKKLMDWYVAKEVETASARATAQQEEYDSGMAALNTRWGAAAPRQIALCHQVVAELGGPAVKKVLDETGAGNAPALVEMLAKIGGMMAEDKMIQPVNVGQTSEQAVADIAAIRAEHGKNRQGPLFNRSHPEHKAVAKRLADLYQIAYPGMRNEDGSDVG